MGSLAGGCSKDNANLEAMACQIGYTWDEEGEASVEAPQALIASLVGRAKQLHHVLKCPPVFS